MSSPKRKEEGEENNEPIDSANGSSPGDHLAEKVVSTTNPTKKRGRKSPKTNLQSKRRKVIL